MSTHRQSDGVVIVSFSLVNPNHAPHSTPPPLTVVQLVRVGLSSLFLSAYAGSGAHHVCAEKPQADRNGSGVALDR
jgi:hypothetical protein